MINVGKYEPVVETSRTRSEYRRGLLCMYDGVDFTYLVYDNTKPCESMR